MYKQHGAYFHALDVTADLDEVTDGILLCRCLGAAGASSGSVCCRAHFRQYCRVKRPPGHRSNNKISVNNVSTSKTSTCDLLTWKLWKASRHEKCLDYKSARKQHPQCVLMGRNNVLPVSARVSDDNVMILIDANHLSRRAQALKHAVSPAAVTVL